MSFAASISMQGVSLQPAFADALLTGQMVAMPAATAATAALPHIDSALTAYNSALLHAPLETKSATAAVLACAGDAFAQRITSSIQQGNSLPDGSDMNEFEYDWRRGLAFATFGACYTGAFQHVWFSWLDDHLVGGIVDLTETIGLPGLLDCVDDATGFDLVLPAPSPELVAAEKVAVNQFCVIPVLYMPLYFCFTGALGGMTLEASVKRMRTLYGQILRRNYAFWLPTQFLVFFALPIEYQVPTLCAASFVWTIILSTLGSTKAADSLEASAEKALPATVDAFSDTVTLKDTAGTLGAQGGLVAAGIAIAGVSGAGSGAADAFSTLVDSGLRAGPSISAVQDVLADAQAIPLALALGSTSDAVSDAVGDLVEAELNSDDE
eukprot:CAMPEP_0115881818 /NCGR_PEP_ID=MMETSP0287-20121206/28657_1 /TAXON_ID=412157 /ORGANISM="Chrysochromulina rotalis, Strain UIO044" /LENGTH=380 /DNA_ID=CAMNT_0003337821 /DNA_START=1 /DNA_END=1143 /DNA_ORIENTATION=+